MADKVARHVVEPGSSSPSMASSPLMSLRGEVDRLFDNFFPTAFGHSLFDVDSWHGQSFSASGDMAPDMDVRECANRYEVSVELPGMDEKDVSVKVQGGMLTVSGEKKLDRDATEGAMHLTERSFGAFTRAVRLPGNVDAAGITAEYARGVLTVNLPKQVPGTDEKKIAVKAH